MLRFRGSALFAMIFITGASVIRALGQNSGSKTGLGKPQLTYSAEQKPAAATIGYKSVVVPNVNIFRFDVSVRIEDKVFDAQTPITGLQPPAKKAEGSDGAKKRKDETDQATLKQLVGDKSFTALSKQSILVEQLLSDRRQMYDDVSVADKAEQADYQQVISSFASSVLTSQRKANLLANLTLINGERAPDHDWQSELDALRGELRQLVISTQDYREANPTTDVCSDAQASQRPLNVSCVERRNTSLATDIQSFADLIRGTDASARSIYLRKWRARGASALASESSGWNIGPLALECHVQWFGKTDGQIISLVTVDQNQDSAPEVVTAITTNQCLPTLTVTSGLGLTTVRSSTFAFVSKTDYSISTPASTQVIGYATDSRVLPIYVAQMNYRVLGRSFELHGSGGLGVSSSSAGTAADFFTGPGLSFARRTIFITPAYHLTQRQTLQDGYSVGNPKADLSAVPTINRWRQGFVLTITFPILGK